MIDVILLCTVFGVFILVAYDRGLKNGQNINKSNIQHQPIKNPIKTLKENKERKVYEEKQLKEQTKLEIMLENIDNYDGTELGQKDLK